MRFAFPPNKYTQMTSTSVQLFEHNRHSQRVGHLLQSFAYRHGIKHERGYAQLLFAINEREDVIVSPSDERVPTSAELLRMVEIIELMALRYTMHRRMAAADPFTRKFAIALDGGDIEAVSRMADGDATPESSVLHVVGARNWLADAIVSGNEAMYDVLCKNGFHLQSFPPTHTNIATYAILARLLESDAAIGLFIKYLRSQESLFVQNLALLPLGCARDTIAGRAVFAEVIALSVFANPFDDGRIVPAAPPAAQRGSVDSAPPEEPTNPPDNQEHADPAIEFFESPKKKTKRAGLRGYVRDDCVVADDDDVEVLSATSEEKKQSGDSSFEADNADEDNQEEDDVDEKPRKRVTWGDVSPSSSSSASSSESSDEAYVEPVDEVNDADDGKRKRKRKRTPSALAVAAAAARKESLSERRRVTAQKFAAKSGALSFLPRKWEIATVPYTFHFTEAATRLRRTSRDDYTLRGIDSQRFADFVHWLDLPYEEWASTRFIQHVGPIVEGILAGIGQTHGVRSKHLQAYVQLALCRRLDFVTNVSARTHADETSHGMCDICRLKKCVAVPARGWYDLTGIEGLYELPTRVTSFHAGAWCGERFARTARFLRLLAEAYEEQGLWSPLDMYCVLMAALGDAQESVTVGRRRGPVDWSEHVGPSGGKEHHWYLDTEIVLDVNASDAARAFVRWQRANKTL